MKKLDYIVKQLSKTNKKNYENYVVTRIWHRLDNIEYKMITQQYVIRPDGTYAMTDMYFPQLGIHIEVDEKFHKDNIEKDKIRELDIINVTGHDIYRVDITKGVEDVNNQIDLIVDKIIKRRSDIRLDFEPWDPDRECSSETYIKKGYIDIKDNVAFDRIVDGINCFGITYNGFQRGGINHPIEDDVHIWFPKLYPNNLWINNISADENTIYEKSAIDNKVDKHINQVINECRHKRIVFDRVIDSLGDIKYRFKGLYELNIDRTLKERQVIWERKKTKVSTYPSHTSS